MLNQAFIQFHQLPSDVKLAVTSPQAMERIDKLESTYRISLADLIVQVMIRKVTIADLASHLENALHLPKDKAQALAGELQITVLAPVLSYLKGGAPKSIPVPTFVAPTPQNSRSPMSRSADAPSIPLGLASTPAAMGVPPRVQPPRTPPVSQPAPQHIPDAIRHALPQRQVSTASQGKAAYYIFAEDEAEISKHRERLEKISGASPTALVEERISAIIANHAIPNSDAVLQKRLRGFVLSRLRDVRTADEFTELLVRPIKVGGLGFDAALAGRFAADVEAEARELHDRTQAGHLAEAKPAAAAPPVVQPASRAPVVPAPITAPLQEKMSQPSAPKPAPSAAPIPLPVEAPTPPRQPIRRTAPPIAFHSQRLVHDIRKPARPVSPVDELAQLQADDFRSMGTDLEDSVAKVVEKIQLLGEESLEKRADGVKAWRGSGIYQLYLSMGRESMGGGKSIEEITADRKRRNEPYLTSAEFGAIADLNKQLTI